MIDKNSQEWKDYCEGLLRLDDYAENGVFMVPADPQSALQVDWKAYLDFVEQNYHGDSSQVTEEEKDRFIITRQQRKTA